MSVSKLVLLALALVSTLSLASADDDCKLDCPKNWIVINGACARPCNNPGFNSVRGLCTGGANPYAGVYCNSVEGSRSGILVTDRYNVKTGYVCKKNSDCNMFGSGFICNYYAPQSQATKDTPKPTCAKPAAPACFPLIPFDKNIFPPCTSTATCPQ